MRKFQLEKKYIISGEIEAISGLHIGGTDTGFSIGSTDNTVIRNPLTNLPYIPGSSLKGKMRTLLAIRDGVKYDKFSGFDGTRDSHDSLVAKLFGSANSKNGRESQRPSRVIIRDAELCEGYENYASTEFKTEVVINRITSAATPRIIERVAAGAKFDLKIILNVFKDDEIQENPVEIEPGSKEDKLSSEDYICHVLNGLKLIEDDYLGGNGSRGSGQVKFTVTEIRERYPSYYHTKFDDESDEEEIKTGGGGNDNDDQNDVTDFFEQKFQGLVKKKKQE